MPESALLIKPDVLAEDMLGLWRAATIDDTAVTVLTLAGRPTLEQLRRNLAVFPAHPNAESVLAVSWNSVDTPTHIVMPAWDGSTLSTLLKNEVSSCKLAAISTL